MARTISKEQYDDCLLEIEDHGLSMASAKTCLDNLLIILCLDIETENFDDSDNQ